MTAGIFILSCTHPICEDIDKKGPPRLINPGKYSINLKPGEEGKDAAIVSYYPDSNYASCKSLNAIFWTYYRNQYKESGFIDFDLNKIPKGAKINKGILKLYADTTNLFERLVGHIDFTRLKSWRLNLVTSSWEENTITWFNKPNVERSDLFLIPAPTYNSQSFSIDVTEYVQKKVTKSPGVYGFSIDFALGDLSQPTMALRFCSSDHQNREFWPELYVEYEILD